MDKGLPIFKMALKSIKGWFPTSKGGENDKMPFVSTREEKFLYYAEYNPLIKHIERVDINEKFAQQNNIISTVQIPIVIPYRLEDKSLLYYPDYLLKLENGQKILVEVGRLQDKKSLQALLKAKAAIEFCEKKGWQYWLVVEEKLLNKAGIDNLIILKSYDKHMYKLKDIQKKALEFITSHSDGVSIKEVIDELIKGNSIRNDRIEMSIYQLLSLAAKEGRLVCDLCKEVLTKDSVIQITHKEELKACLPFVHLSYEEIQQMFEETNNLENISLTIEEEQKVYHIDSTLISEEKQGEFLRRRAAIREVLNPVRLESIREIASRHGLTRTNLHALIKKYKEYGEEALVPYNNYNGKATFIDKLMQQIILKIVKKRPDRSLSSKLSY